MALSAAAPSQPETHAPVLPHPALEAACEPRQPLVEAVSEAAHELRNTLTSLSFQLEEAAERSASEELRAALELARRSVGTAASIIRRLEAQALGGAMTDWAAVDLNQILLEVAETTRFRWWRPAGDARRPIQLRLDLREVPPVRGQAADLTRVFTNLVLNACEALGEGGEVLLRTRYDGSQVMAVVADNGPGMSEEVRRCLFARHFSTKPGDHRGLGLSIVQGIVREHGGHVLLDSAAGRGTSFCLLFPDARASRRAG